MLKIVILLIFLSNGTFGARILGYVPTPSYSHQIAFHKIWESLSKAGHQVVVITTDPINDPKLTNLTEVDVSFAYKYMSTELQEKMPNLGVTEFIEEFLEYGRKIVESQLSSAQVKKVLNEKFDVLLIEMLYPELNALGYHFNAPVIAISSMDGMIDGHMNLGNPANPVIHPDLLLPFTAPLSFKERVIAFAYTYLFGPYIMKSYAVQKKALTLKKYLPHVYKNVDIFDIFKNYEMMFINTNPALQPIRSYGPQTIPFGGGINLKEPKPLPKDLQTFLDEAPNGVIYFSLGSNIRSRFIGQERINFIMNTLRNLTQRVLWKFELDTIDNLPENVKTIKWAPQQDILRHKNIKFFITQGGQQSMEEALFNHVPMVVLPFFADQEHNAEIIHKKGIGIHVKNKPFNGEMFKKAINEILSTSKYHERVKKVAQLCLDQPMTGPEKAVWWTEYVIRHKGAAHFKEALVKVPFYQEHFLDIFAFLIVLLTFFCMFIYFSFKTILRFFKSKKDKEKLIYAGILFFS